jgi:Pyruvate/2-oxoacid:ferredoxin oxidoreductase delta subunit
MSTHVCSHKGCSHIKQVNSTDIKNALHQVKGCIDNLNLVKNVIAKLNTAHKNHKKWLKFSSMLVRSTLEKGTPEYNEFVMQTVHANTEFNKSFQVDEEHIKLFENVIQVSCKVCFDYCSDDVKKIVKQSLESTHNYLESIDYLSVYLNQVKKYINSQKSKVRGNK